MTNTNHYWQISTINLVNEKDLVTGQVIYQKGHGWFWVLGKPYENLKDTSSSREHFQWRFCSLWLDPNHDKNWYETPEEAQKDAIKVAEKEGLVYVENKLEPGLSPPVRDALTNLLAERGVTHDKINELQQIIDDCNGIQQKEIELTKAQETACALDQDQRYCLESIYKGWPVTLDSELFESLESFGCLDEDFKITYFGIEVGKALKEGFGK